MADDALFTIAGQEFKVTSPDRVFYPATGTTKLDVIRYYAEASAADARRATWAGGELGGDRRSTSRPSA